MKRYVFAAVLVGVALPGVWMWIYHANPSFGTWWLHSPGWVETARLVLWPSALLLIADPLDNNVSLWIASALSNGALYGLVAWLVARSVRR